MSRMADLDIAISELIEAEEKTDWYATCIGNVDHIHPEHEPVDLLEDAYITALVRAEILAENLVDIIHPQAFKTDDNFWNAVVNVRMYVQNTDVNELNLSDLAVEINKAD